MLDYTVFLKWKLDDIPESGIPEGIPVGIGGIPEGIGGNPGNIGSTGIMLVPSSGKGSDILNRKTKLFHLDMKDESEMTEIEPYKIPIEQCYFM